MIVKKNQEEGKTNQAFIEGFLAPTSNLKDTLLYYKFDLLTDSVTFQKKPSLDIGIFYSNMSEGNSHVINLAFNRLEEELKSSEPKTVLAGNKMTFTNIKNLNRNKGIETSFNFTNDKYLEPTTSTYITSEEKMMAFLNLFKEEIQNGIESSDLVSYYSTSHVNGYFQRLVIDAKLQ